MGVCEVADIPEPFTVAIFRKSPLRLGPLQRALRRLRKPAGEVTVLVAYDLTIEALNFAKSRSVMVVAKRQFWTEAEYDEIHTIIATGKKRPIR